MTIKPPVALGGGVFVSTGGKISLFTAGLADPATVNLSGNLFQANVSENDGGAISVVQASVLTSKGDKFIGNVATFSPNIEMM